MNVPKIISKISSSKIYLFGFFTAFIFLIYFQSLKTPFILDDTHTIVSNAAIQTPSNLLKLWTSAKYYSSSPDNYGYRPVTTLSNSLLWLAGKGSSVPFEVFKKTVFAMLCVLMVVFWRKYLHQLNLKTKLPWSAETSELFSFVAVLLFAAHPANTQVVNYIAASSTLICSFFYLLALHRYLHYRESKKPIELLYIFIALLLSLLSKEEGITLPAIVTLLEMSLARTKKEFFSNLKLPILAILLSAATGLGLIAAMFEPSSNSARGNIPRMIYFMTQWRAYIRYFRLPFWATDMNADNLSFGFSEGFGPAEIMALLFNLAMTALAFIGFRKNIFLFMGILWFYIAISPASSIIPLAEPVNDHRMFISYLAYVPCLVFAAIFFFYKLSEKTKAPIRKGAWAVTFILVAVLSGSTWARNKAWLTNKSIWYDTIQKNPNSGRAMNNYTLELMREANYKESIYWLDRCIGVFKSYMECRLNKGIVLSKLGKDSDAEALYLDSMKYDRTGVPSRYFFTKFLMSRGRYTEGVKWAEAAYQMSFERNIGVIEVYLELLQLTHNSSQYKIVWEKAWNLFPSNPTLVRLRPK